MGRPVIPITDLTSRSAGTRMYPSWPADCARAAGSREHDLCAGVAHRSSAACSGPGCGMRWAFRRLVSLRPTRGAEHRASRAPLCPAQPASRAPLCGCPARPDAGFCSLQTQVSRLPLRGPQKAAGCDPHAAADPAVRDAAPPARHPPPAPRASGMGRGVERAAAGGHRQATSGSAMLVHMAESYDAESRDASCKRTH